MPMTVLLVYFQIYPYWNVNANSFGLSNEAFYFQIYPYWNVNADSFGLGNEAFYLSNLSILECKPATNNQIAETMSPFKVSV